MTLSPRSRKGNALTGRTDSAMCGHIRVEHGDKRGAVGTSYGVDDS